MDAHHVAAHIEDTYFREAPVLTATAMEALVRDLKAIFQAGVKAGNSAEMRPNPEYPGGPWIPAQQSFNVDKKDLKGII
jgi:hypothetical protein